MNLRPLTLDDLDRLLDIDAVIDATHYIHVDRQGEGLEQGFKVEQRVSRDKSPRPSEVDDDLNFALKQLATGAEDGIAMVAEHEGQLVALVAGMPDVARGTVELIDLRVDFDRRREGLGSALLYQIINYARDREARAIRAEVRSNNLPINALLAKTGFELAGLDTHRTSNHDLVKEQATLIWYLVLG
ncbi:MAG: GNAT family N-acetyltransferase [Tepidisphaeraceae bacterium]